MAPFDPPLFSLGLYIMLFNPGYAFENIWSAFEEGRS